MGLVQLMTWCRSRYEKQEVPGFIQIVKAVTVYDTERKWLTRPPARPSEERFQEIDTRSSNVMARIAYLNNIIRENIRE